MSSSKPPLPGQPPRINAHDEDIAMPKHRAAGRATAAIAQRGRRGPRTRTVREAIILFAAALLAACGSDGGGSQGVAPSPEAVPASPSAVPPSSGAWIGHFVGTVKIANMNYYGDALLTAQGAMRLYVGGPYAATGAIQMTRPESSEQLVGELQVQGNQGAGAGVVIGQQCAAGTPGRFCGATSPAEISLAASSGADAGGAGELNGEIEVTTGAGQETWLVNLQSWSDNAVAGPLSGLFKELLAEFSPGGDVVVSIDAAGPWFFQSALTGCTGNGTFAPHAGGAADTWDAMLTIESCSGTYAYLNGTYDGLATTTASSYWDYDSLLRVWLSKRAGEGPAAALTMLADPL